MIDFLAGNILNSHAEVIVNPVNCLGVSGAGLALQLKQRFPKNYRIYRQICKAGKLRPGRVLIVAIPKIIANSPQRYIANFPTKDDWRDPSKLEYITSGLKRLIPELKAMKVKSIAFPKLGCGLGGLSWETQVYPAIEKAFNSVPDIKVY